MNDEYVKETIEKEKAKIDQLADALKQVCIALTTIGKELDAIYEGLTKLFVSQQLIHDEIKGIKMRLNHD